MLIRALTPTLQAFYGGLRYGLYAPLRNMMGVDADTPKSQIPLHIKFAAGGTAGALAAFLATPTDLMKVKAAQGALAVVAVVMVVVVVLNVPVGPLPQTCSL